MSRYRAFWTWLENSLGSCASVAGSQYFIVARKRTYPIKPIKPHWHLKRRFSPVGASFRAGVRRASLEPSPLSNSNKKAD